MQIKLDETVKQAKREAAEQNAQEIRQIKESLLKQYLQKEEAIRSEEQCKTAAEVATVIR